MDELVLAWKTAGHQQPRAPSGPNSTLCAVALCPGLPFAEITTSNGTVALCWKHFEAVDTQG